MRKPIIFDNKTKACDLEKEKITTGVPVENQKTVYFGSNQVLPLALKFSPDNTETAYICMCKATNNPSYCDGAHQNLKKSDTSTSTTIYSMNNTIKYLITFCLFPFHHKKCKR